MARRPVILLATEGTYPFHPGGVSTWCDTLIHRMPDVDFIVFAIAMNPYVSIRFSMPSHVQSVVTVPLWGTQDPSEHRQDAAFSQIFLRKQRTTAAEIERLFIPLFDQVLGQMRSSTEDPEVVGEALAGLYRYFQVFDYQMSFKNPVVWEHYREWVVGAAIDGFWESPTVFEAVQSLGWIYHFFTVLNTTLPEVDLVHSSAAAFCGMAGIVSKIQFGSPYILTEHGVYLREQYLSVGRSNMSGFAKRFLISLIQTVVKANLHYADELSPVCAFNARWERLLGADPGRIRVIYNGVDPQVFTPAAEPPGGDRLEVLCVARSDPNKDLESLLHAAAIVEQKIGGVRFVVRGAVSVPEYHAKLLDLRSELDLGSVVDFPGATANIAESYRGADIVVQSSVSEAFPYSVIESMMSGVPVVATDVGGTREAIGDTGLLVPARDPARLALALIVLAQDKKLRERLGQAARERALNFFTVARTIRLYQETYLRLAGMGPLAADAQRQQLLALDRAYALMRVGLAAPALDQLRGVMAANANNPMAAFLMAQMAQLERSLGQTEQGLRHMVSAWLLNHLEQLRSTSA